MENIIFDNSRVNFAKMAPEVSLNDRFYKVFHLTFLEAPKRCVTNAFLMFCEVVKRLQLLLINIMVFDGILGRFSKMASKGLHFRQVL